VLHDCALYDEHSCDGTLRHGSWWRGYRKCERLAVKRYRGFASADHMWWHYFASDVTTESLDLAPRASNSMLFEKVRKFADRAERALIWAGCCLSVNGTCRTLEAAHCRRSAEYRYAKKLALHSSPFAVSSRIVAKQ
jgi:hypothetical protein